MVKHLITSSNLLLHALNLLTRCKRMLILICLTLLPPANEVWSKVIFSVACVKNSVHRGRSALVHAGICPPPKQGRTPPPARRHSPGKETPCQFRSPCAVHARRYGQQTSGMHPTLMQSCFKINDFGGNKSARYNQVLVLTNSL